MLIKTIKVGNLRTNCYIVYDETANEGIVIDPGDDVEDIIKEIGQIKIKAIVLTHGHYDHVTDAFKLKKRVDAPVMVGRKDEMSWMISYTAQKADAHLNDGDELKVGGLTFRVIATPGHTAGSMSLYNEREKALFSGDTLFEGTYGRTDFPGGSEEEMIASLKKLLALPGDTAVYPGHGRNTTIEAEKNLIE
ncbi:MAG TPA: MBL fold metallo-hydrolase [Candidatus Omnitrophota bacterium]|nr:MBL fold metallo-hydrolase [Candidatus Omnitrophota bacterium]